MTLLVAPHTTVDYVYVDISHRSDGTPATELKPNPVRVALAPYGTDTADVTWVDAAWAPDLPATVRWLYEGTLPAGVYTLYSKTTDPPTEPEIEHGEVLLT